MWKKFYQFIIEVYYAGRPLRFLIITEVLLLYLVFFLPQGREILHISLEEFQYADGGPWLKAGFIFLIFITVVLFLSLSGTVFYRTFLLYRDKDSDIKFDPQFELNRIQRIEQALIYFLMAVPVLAYLIYWGFSDLYTTWPVALIQLVVLSLMIVSSIRDDKLIRSKDDVKASKTYFNVFMVKPWKQLSWALWLVPIIILLLPDNVQLARLIGSLGLIMLASYVFFHIIFLIHLLRMIIKKKKKLKIDRPPVFTVFIIWVLCCSYFNANHEVRTINEGPGIDSRKEIGLAVKDWISSKFDSSTEKRRVYIVAAEGGGSRAAYWTVGVLNFLSDSIPDFNENLLAVSSVSGGTVGAGIFLAGRNIDLQSGNAIDPDKIQRAAGEDFLSPVLAGFFFTDLVQRFLPFPMKIWDRSRRLESSISKSLEGLIEENGALKNPLGRPTMERHEKEPFHFINSTVVETGGKGIWSPLKLDTTFFPGVLDLPKLLGYDVRRSTSLVNSARFPLVTPGGELKKDGKTIAHLVDGGYFENTGIETAFSVLRVLQEAGDSTIQPVFIYIQNSKDITDIDPARSSLTAANPILVFYNAWSSRSPNNEALVDNLEELMDFEYFHIPLRHELGGEPYPYPLAWVLSKRSKAGMKMQIDTLGDRSELHSLWKN